MSKVVLHFEEFGEAHLPPLLILHGFFASNRNWRHISKQLSDSYHVYSIDLRNHGASPHDPLMDYPSMALDVKGFIEDHGLNTVDILGHSMGGKVAMWFALHHPEQLCKLIVVDIAPVSYQHSFDGLIDTLLELPLDELSNRKQADEWLRKAIEDLSFRQFLLQNLVLVDGHYQWRINLNYFKQAGLAIIEFPELDSGLRYPKPITVLAGENSKYVDKAAVFRLFPQADIQQIANSGHWPHVEAPEAFLAAVRTSLEQA